MEIEKKIVRGTTATYKEDGQLVCDLELLAKTYLSIGRIPERLSFSKAGEIALLSEAFLILYKKHIKQNEKNK